MEDVLDLYAEPFDPQGPAVCFDETSTQLLSGALPPLAAEPGKPGREDYECRREGTRNLFLACEPLAGWRHEAVTHRRTMQDFANQMRWLVDEAYPGVPVIGLVLDHLNTHRKASLLPDLSGGGGAAHRQEAGVSPHSQACQLAEYGGDRVPRAGPGLPSRTQRR